MTASEGLLSREGCPGLLSLPPSVLGVEAWAGPSSSPVLPLGTRSPGGVSASRSPLGRRRPAPIPGPLRVGSLTTPRLRRVSLLFPPSGRPHVGGLPTCPRDFQPCEPFPVRLPGFISPFSSCHPLPRSFPVCPSHAHPGAEAPLRRAAPSLFTWPAPLRRRPWRMGWGGISSFLLCCPCCPACGISVPQQGSNPCPLLWECRVLATGPPGKFQTSVVCRNLYQLEMICSLDV